MPLPRREIGAVSPAGGVLYLPLMIGFLAMVLASILGIGAGALLFLASAVSWGEGESRAAFRLGGAALVAFLLCLGIFLLPGSWVVPVAVMVTLPMLVVVAVLLSPLQGQSIADLGDPLPGVDERDIMFSRAELSPGSQRFAEYYAAHPERRALDDAFRGEAGLLAPGSAHFHPLAFPAADAAFWTIERLRPHVEGDTGSMPAEAGPGGAPTADLASRDIAAGNTSVPDAGVADIDGTTRFLKEWARKLGAHSVGVTELRSWHVYSHVGRGSAYGEPVELTHSRALALTVEMDKEMVDRAPRAPTVMESAREYLQAGVIAVQLAELIRRLGFRARAHVDGNYRVICPLVARDAGLGEIGRMGLLMTPRLGPRVRIAVVTTDLPLVPDPRVRDLTVLDFCAHCAKCAKACPSGAIPTDGPQEDEHGVKRWKIDSEACFTLWARLGTDCARCMAVCPYSHPDNVLHNAVRWGIRRNAAFRRSAVWMDDVLYGARPAPGELPEWMRVSETDSGVEP